MGDSFDRVSSDAGLRAVLKTARAWGVSPRRFLGWEPTRTLTHTYANGVIVRTVENLEVEWDDDNRDLAISYAMWEADLCPGCHRPLTETTTAGNEGLYVAAMAIRCHSCTAHAQAADVYSESPHPEALFIPIDLRSRPEVNADGRGSEDHGTGGG